MRYLINPLNSFYALGAIAAKPFQRDESVVLPLGEDAKLGASYSAQNKPPLLLLVLGETARSGNFSLNGYNRPTNPLLAKENVVSLRNAWSCGTSTAASVPCMGTGAPFKPAHLLASIVSHTEVIDGNSYTYRNF